MDTVPERERTPSFHQYYKEVLENMIVLNYNTYVFRDDLNNREMLGRSPHLDVN